MYLAVDMHINEHNFFSAAATRLFTSCSACHSHGVANAASCHGRDRAPFSCFKDKNMASSCTRNKCIPVVEVAERQRARPQNVRVRSSNPMYRGQCYLLILVKFNLYFHSDDTEHD